MISIRRLSTLLLVLAAGAATAAEPAKAPVPTYSIKQFLSTTIYNGSSFSPDGTKILLNSNQTGVANAFALPVDGGPAKQLTDSKVSAVFAIGYFPKDERFLYASDQGGNERIHLYVQSPDGSSRDLTPGDGPRAEFGDWFPDDKAFHFATNERDPSAMDAYEMSLDGYERTLLYKNEGGYELGPISPDRRYIALSKTRSTNDADVFLYDRTADKLLHLTADDPADVDVQNQPACFSPDGKAFYFASNRGAEFAYLVRYDLATGERREVLRAEWDVIFADFSRDGRYFGVAINRDASTEVRLFDAATMKPIELPAMPDADVTGVNFSPDGKWMSFYAESSAPRNLYVREISTGKIRQLTQSLSKEIDPAHLVDSEVVRFKSYDGVEIPGLLYKPHGAGPAKKVPALVWVHGGPGGQSRVGYSDLTQYLVNHGYAVYQINNRGSTGYGKTFFAMDDRKHGSADLDDCVASKKMLAATGWIDPDRIGIIGGSYGGYMVLAALAFRPQEFNVGVDIFGVSNWLRTLSSIPAWWGPMRDALYKEMGDPVKDEAYLRRISPLFHADRIERPLIVLQGANDPRVLKAESDEIVEAARKKGVPVEYLVFEDEGHGFQRTETREKAYTAVLSFLDRHLKGGSGPKDAG